VERVEAEAIYEQGRDVVVAVLLRMDEQIQRLERRVAQQDERISQLERRLGRSSRNSSQPPSADPPSTPRSKSPTGRKQGAQPGHEGKGRELLPVSAVDEVIEHWPAGCGCGHVFAVGELVAVGVPARHQVEELPLLAVTVTEHRCQRVRCPDCGASPRGVLPAGVGESAFGPRLQAAVTVLSVRNRISRRDVVELCEQLFGARISSGTIDAIVARRRRRPRRAVRGPAGARPLGAGGEHGRDRLAPARRPTRDLGHVHRAPRDPADHAQPS
jgi:transposase